MKIVQTNISRTHYTQLDISTLSVGETYDFHIFIKQKNNYVIILEAGTLLSSKLFKMLETKGNLYISKDIGKVNRLFELIQKNRSNYENSLTLLYKANNNLFSKFLESDKDIIDTDLMKEIVQSSVYLIKENINYIKDTMNYFSLDYSLAYHSIHVSLYAIHLGYFLGLEDEKLTHLGTAGLLHDIGTKKINDAIKKKDSKLNLREREAIQKHAKYSGELAQKNHIHNPYILDAIIHHHEAHDGSGYPHHLRSKDINMLASILAISDSFDALTNDRVYRKKHSSFEALKIMMQEESMVNKLHKDYLKVFLQSFLK